MCCELLSPPLRTCTLHRANFAGPTGHVRRGGARGADLNLASERERKVKHSLRIVCLVQIQGR
jgi:hypothetical protein